MGFTDIFKGKNKEDSQDQGQQNQEPCQCGCHRGAVEVEGCAHCKAEAGNGTDLGNQKKRGEEEATGSDAPKYTHVLKEVVLPAADPGADSNVQPETLLTVVEAEEVAKILEQQSQDNWDVKHFEIVRDGKVITLSLVDYREGEKHPATLEALDGE